VKVRLPSRRAPRAYILASVAAGAIALAAVLVTRGSDSRPPCRSALIPAYVPPSAIADLVERSDRPRVLIVNPSSGPGTRPHPAYQEAVRSAREAGTRVLGYVPTNYGTRDLNLAMADIDRYHSWYGVDGIFVDEAAHTDERLGYYRALSSGIRASRDQLIVLNPGVVPARGYFEAADIVVSFEGPYTDYPAALERMPDWVRRMPPKRIAHLVYAASAEQARRVVQSRTEAGYLYVTSESLPNPWGALPPYLDEEEALLETCRQSVNDHRS
jgi:Spherulation-specific family 4